VERPYAPPPPAQGSTATTGAPAGAGTPAEGSQFGEVAGQVLSYGREWSQAWWKRAYKAMAKHAREIVPTSAEQDALARNGVQSVPVQRHFVWRRSLLWLLLVPATFAAVTGTISQFVEGFQWATGFGVFMTLIYIASLWAIPVTSLLAARSWDRPRVSRRILLIGLVVSYGATLLWGLLPIHWMIKLDESDPDLVAAGKQVVQVVGALAIFFSLLPAILSLLPGAIRACVRIKVLFPESIVSGWLLITLTPVYALLLLTLFVLINQMSGNFLLILGTALVVAAPAAYIAHTGLFIRPVWTDQGLDQVERAQWMYQIILASGFGLLMLYALTGRVLGFPIVKFGRTDGMIGFWSFAWNAFQFAVDYIARSLFITAIAMDYFLLVNVSVWRNMKQFEGTERAKEYEGVVEELGRALGQ
jgi:hypothetical protein